MLALQVPLFAPRATSVSYSELKALVKKGKVANLTLDKETISGTLSTDGGVTRPFVTTRVDDPGLAAKREVLTARAKLLIEKEVVGRDDLTALLDATKAVG